MSHINAVILVSGRGSNMDCLLKAALDPSSPVRYVGVISNIANVPALKLAESYNVPAIAIPHKNYDSREAFEEALDARLTDLSTDLVVCAGFMRRLTPWFVKRWRGRAINIHPSLLPKFRGLNVHEQVIEAGETESGCTVHRISDEVDSGEILAQEKVEVLKSDDAAALAQRVLKAEHSLYPKVVYDLAASELAKREKKAHERLIPQDMAQVRTYPAFTPS